MKIGTGGLSKDTAKKVAQMRQYFFVPHEVSEQLEKLENIASRIPSQFKQPITAFCSAISAIHQFTSIPYLLASGNASALHYQRFHMAERIRQIQIEPYPEETAKELTEESETRAINLANQRFAEFQRTNDGLNAILGNITSTLLGGLKDPITKKASNELLFQGLVSIWSAFEVFIRDLLTITLNNFPHLSEDILGDASCKKHFELPKLSIEDLSYADYNLSNKMGDLILGSRDLSDLKAIKILIMSLLKDSSLAGLLNDRQLWMLNQDRHLIVHRRGVIDKRYLQATGAASNIGETLVVLPAKLENCFDVVISAASSILTSFESADFLASSGQTSDLTAQ